MPAKRPQASFEPIPPHFDVRELVESTDNFQYVDRISCEMIETQGINAFERLVFTHVIKGGKPLVIDGFEDLLDQWTFTPTWLRDNHGNKVEHARNLTTKESLPLTIGHYLNNMGPLTEQYFQREGNYKDKNRQRIYLKDIDCPPVWQDKLKDKIPAGLFYLNENSGELGGPGSTEEINAGTGRRDKTRGIGRAGDLMSSLPLDMRAENLMCYIGHEGTFTPSHKEMCASLGQNIMVEASKAVGEDGKAERPGSSIWFMTETKDRHLVNEYWLSILGHDIEVENHFAQIPAWQSAPFNTYVVEQKPGDFILIPPLAPHQVWNRGTRTMKIAWNRTTVETLQMAMEEALPNARMVCRDEQYKNKAIIYYTLLKYSSVLKNVKSQCEANPVMANEYQSSIRLRQIQKDFKKLFELYKNILLSEMFATEGAKEHPEFLAFDSNVTCAYCRGNIFNRFLTCRSCPRELGTDTDEPYDVCMDCYAMGRSCRCTSDLQWVEQWRWKDLLYKYDEWRRIIIDAYGGVTETTPQPLMEERRYYGKRALAQVCQEQLRVRPFYDIKNPPPPEEDEDESAEITVNDDGTIKKAVKKHSKTFLNNHKTCHVCLHRHPKWKMAMCSFCENWWCYGTLYRAHDLLPITVMEDLHWKCPHCQKVCNTGRCRADPRQNSYEPKGTLLGHDTRKVADIRSIDALFAYSVSNLNWISDAQNPRDSSRILALQEAAEHAKLQDATLDDHFEDEHGIRFSPVPEANGDNIDPALGGAGPAPPQPASNTPGGDDPNGEHEVVDEPGMYPEPDEDYRASKPSKKRRRTENQIMIVERATKKKRRKTTGDEEPLPSPAGPTATDANLQFRKVQEQKQLADARDNNRYIIAWAAMRGKKKMVTLTLPPRILAEIAARSAPSQAQSGRLAVILKSDIARPKGLNNTTPNGSVPKVIDRFRYARVEEDDDFRVRARRNDDGSTITRGRHGRYEAIDVPSDPEEPDESYNPSRRRALPDEELLELPDTHVDRRAPRASLPGAGLRVANQQRSGSGRFLTKAQRTAQEKAARDAVAAMEEQNRRAKLMAAEWADGGDHEVIDVEADASELEDRYEDAQEEVQEQHSSHSPPAPPVSYGFTPVNASTPAKSKRVHLDTDTDTEPTPPQQRHSILSGRGGKKIRIVGAKTTDTPARDSESESEDEIPAKAAARVSTGVPTRGGLRTAVAGRGRGRGRGRPTRGR